MTDNENKNEKKDGGQQKGSPFFMVRPDIDSGVEFVKTNPDGTYDVTPLVGLVNQTDKNNYIVVRFVNGRQLDGIIRLSKDDTQYTFASVKPNTKGEIELGLAKVSDRSMNDAAKITVPRSMLLAIPMAKQKASISVTVNFPDNQWNHSVEIKLFDDDGNGCAGNVEITATQRFEIDGVEYTNGRHTLAIPGADGITVNMKALQWNEGFTFTDKRSMQSTKEVLLGVK